MKTKEELNAIKNEVDNLGKKLAALNDEELEQVTGGLGSMPHIQPDEKYVMTLGVRPDGGVDFRQDFDIDPGFGQYEFHFYDDDPDKNHFEPPTLN